MLIALHKFWKKNPPQKKKLHSLIKLKNLLLQRLFYKKFWKCRYLRTFHHRTGDDPCKTLPHRTGDDLFEIWKLDFWRKIVKKKNGESFALPGGTKKFFFSRLHCWYIMARWMVLALIAIHKNRYARWVINMTFFVPMSCSEQFFKLALFKYVFFNVMFPLWAINKIHIRFNL